MSPVGLDISLPTLQQQPPRYVPSKRKSEPSRRYTSHDEVFYPSPPMSNPPSPPRPRPEHKVATSDTTPRPLPTIANIASTTAYAPSAYQLYSSGHYSHPLSFYYGHQTAAPQTSDTHFGTPLTEPPSLPVIQAHSGPTSGATGTAPLPAPADSSGGRGGRKSKAHVASACINCKRAHLSCDVQRPCARCVSSGKQDSCYDVQHKKRGRPRLRDEGEVKAEQMLPESGSRVTVSTMGEQAASGRPMAQPHRSRGDSFRSIRSQTSEGSSVYGLPSPNYVPTGPMQSQYGFQHPLAPPPGRPISPEIPTGFLDLDLVFIKANRSFQQIMLGGQDVRNRRLDHVAIPADGESLQSIRNRLRAEREAREPSYLPPIVQGGQEPVLGVPERDVDQVTQGFEDRTYIWTQAQPVRDVQTFPARIRLAKAGTYFVAVTLPSFHPVEQQAQPPPPQHLQSGHMYASPFAVTPNPPESFGPPRQAVSQSAPPSSYFTHPGVTAPAPPVMGSTSGPRTYPPTHAQMAHQAGPYSGYHAGPPAPTTPRLPIAEPPTEATPFTPRSAARDPIQTMVTEGLNLPPIAASSPTGFKPSSGQQTEQQGSSEEDNRPGGKVRSPKRRRRMGIDDVLHR